MITAQHEVNAAQHNVRPQIDELSERLVELLIQATNHHREGRLPQAENCYREILAIDPLQPNANHNLGVLALDADQANLSLDYFRIALDNDPDEPQFWMSYVDALIKAGQPNHARDVLLSGLELGLHGDEVNALVEQLAKPQKSLAQPIQACNGLA